MRNKYIHKDRFNLRGAVVALPRVFALFFGQLAEGGGSLIVLDNITGSDNVSESIALCYLSAFLTLATNYEDGIILRNHLSHGRMTCDS